MWGMQLSHQGGLTGARAAGAFLTVLNSRGVTAKRRKSLAAVGGVGGGVAGARIFSAIKGMYGWLDESVIRGLD